MIPQAVPQGQFDGAKRGTSPHPYSRYWFSFLARLGGYRLSNERVPGLQQRVDSDPIPPGGVARPPARPQFFQAQMSPRPAKNAATPRRPILGAHMSIAGGYFEAVERAHRAGCDCVQIFTKNNNQWNARPIDSEEIEAFRGALAKRGVGHPLSHSSYLINLASPDDPLWRKSIDAMVVELRRAAQLGIPYVVLHPGASTTSSEKAGLRRVTKALNEVFRQTRKQGAGVLLETTAGQGTCLGHAFEHLAEILDRSQSPERLGVCLDTCHVFAAGHALSDQAAYERLMDRFDDSIGLDRIKAFHLNDSKRELGSRVDRHDHIGRGHVGVEGFRLLVNDPRFHEVPMYLETPKGEEKGRDLDRINLAKLRRLVARS